MALDATNELMVRENGGTATSLDYCLLLRTNEASPYDDKEGHIYHFTSNVPNNKKIKPGVKVVFDRKSHSGPLLIGSAVIGEVRDDLTPREDIGEKRPARHFIAELRNYTPFEVQRGVTSNERQLLENNERFRYNVQHAIRPISWALYESLLSETPKDYVPDRLVDSIEEIIDNIRSFGSYKLEDQKKVPLGYYFVYDTISGWIAPCKYAGIHAMSIERYQNFLRQGSSLFKADKTHDRVKKLCNLPTQDAQLITRLNNYFKDRGVTPSRKSVLYIAGPNANKEPLLERFCKEIRTIPRGTAEGEKKLHKPLMLLAACRTTFSNEPLTYKNLSARVSEFADAIGEHDIRPYYPYSRLRPKLIDTKEDTPFWNILDQKGQILTEVYNSQGPLEDTSIEWTGCRKECIIDKRLLPSVLEAILSFFPEEQSKKLAAIWPLLNSDKDFATPPVLDEKNLRILSPHEIIRRSWSYIRAQGFSFTPLDIIHFYLSLKTKPFVILAGPSGSGKTKLATFFARALGYEAAIIPVQPDWTDRSDLIGYRDLNDTFKKQHLMELLIEACKEENRERPYLVILDEMNLARVEHYFNDFLSRIESRERRDDGSICSDPIFSGLELRTFANGEELEGICFPDNFFLIGTVNMDETTHPFSRKVLDRANTMEMGIGSLRFPESADELVENSSERIHVDSLRGAYARLERELYDEDPGFFDGIVNEIERVNKILKRGGFEIGYRVRDEMCLYCWHAKDFLGWNDSMILKKGLTLEEVLDFQWLQKLLPRIQGALTTLRPILTELFRFFTGAAHVDPFLGDTSSYAEEALGEWKDSISYPRSAVRLARMITKARNEHYTSFWV